MTDGGIVMNILLVPDEILLQIMQYLTLYDFLNLRKVRGAHSWLPTFLATLFADLPTTFGVD